MNAIISIVVSCLLNASPITEGASSGQCSGSYIDQAKGQVVGAWTMQVGFEPNVSAPFGVRVVKYDGRNVVAQRHSAKEADLTAKTILALAEGFQNEDYELVYQDGKSGDNKDIFLASAPL